MQRGQKEDTGARAVTIHLGLSRRRRQERVTRATCRVSAVNFDQERVLDDVRATDFHDDIAANGTNRVVAHGLKKNTGADRPAA